MNKHLSQRSFLVVLLVALVAGALLGVSCHLAWADHPHGSSSCAVCTWFHFKGWITAAVVLLVCFCVQHLVWAHILGRVSFSGTLHPARAPPRR